MLREEIPMDDQLAEDFSSNNLTHFKNARISSVDVDGTLQCIKHAGTRLHLKMYQSLIVNLNVLKKTYSCVLFYNFMFKWLVLFSNDLSIYQFIIKWF